MAIAVFFVPTAIPAIMCLLVMIGNIAIGNAMTSICQWSIENFWVYILIILLFLIISAITFGVIFGFISSLAYVFASSQLIVFFLATLHQLLIVGLDFMGNGWLSLLIGLPIFVIYTMVDVFAILIGITRCDNSISSSGFLWLVGLAGWFMNIFVWS